MQPNRLERFWKVIEPDLLERWNKVSKDDLEACGFQFDLIVELIRKVYYPGRSHLTLEGEIRDWLCERLKSYETAQLS